MSNQNLPYLRIFIILIVIIIVVVVVILTTKKKHHTEGFSSEEFGSLADLDGIKTDISKIRDKLSNEFPDMSKFARKTDVQANSVCRVATAVDKDAYIAKTESEKLSKCPVPADYDPSKYISKSVAMQSQGVTSCPTLNPDQWVLKSTLPPAQECKPCIAPKVKVSAGLCQKCPKPPKCPRPEPCPIPECPKPQPCPPQKECPACPPKERCHPKICPACPAMPTPKVCPKCCDREVIKVIKKIVYVDKNGNEIRSKEMTSEDYASDKAASIDRTSSSGLAIPGPTQAPTNSNKLNQYLAEFSKPTEKPFVQSYKVSDASTVGKSCKSNAFNSEFQQYGVYGDAKNMYNEYLAL
jgi:hypothetical protein